MIAPDHHDYDDARALWNGAVDRRPQLIARCGGAADVAAAVRFARGRDLEIAVRGGGHNVAGTAVCDGGVVIDLSAMRAVSVDPLELADWLAERRVTLVGMEATGVYWKPVHWVLEGSVPDAGLPRLPGRGLPQAGPAGGHLERCG